MAYACLNDWDGLILYNYNTSDKPDEERADEVLTVFDAFNDPALISQFGNYPEGVTYAILLMNIVTPLLDRALKRKVYGEVKQHG